MTTYHCTDIYNHLQSYIYLRLTLLYFYSIKYMSSQIPLPERDVFAKSYIYLRITLLHFYSIKYMSSQIPISERDVFTLLTLRKRDVFTPLAFRKGEKRYKQSPHNYN